MPKLEHGLESKIGLPDLLSQWRVSVAQLRKRLRGGLPDVLYPNSSHKCLRSIRRHARWDEAEEIFDTVFPSSDEATVVLHPGKDAFDLPSVSIAA